MAVLLGAYCVLRAACCVLTFVPRTRTLQGTPFAYFPSQSCSIADHFDSHNLIINLSLCTSPFAPVHAHL